MKTLIILIDSEIADSSLQAHGGKTIKYEFENQTKNSNIEFLSFPEVSSTEISERLEFYVNNHKNFDMVLVMIHKSNKNALYFITWALKKNPPWDKIFKCANESDVYLVLFSASYEGKGEFEKNLNRIFENRYFFWKVTKRNIKNIKNFCNHLKKGKVNFEVLINYDFPSMIVKLNQCFLPGLIDLSLLIKINNEKKDLVEKEIHQAAIGELGSFVKCTGYLYNLKLEIEKYCKEMLHISFSLEKALRNEFLAGLSDLKSKFPEDMLKNPDEYHIREILEAFDCWYRQATDWWNSIKKRFE